MDIFSYYLCCSLLNNPQFLVDKSQNTLALLESKNQQKLLITKNDRLFNRQREKIIITQVPFLNLQGKKVIPIDEAEVNADFAIFRQELKQALERKDVEFLLSHLDENVKLTFGGMNGKKDFIKLWKLDKNPEKSEVWQVLLNVIELGGKFEDRQRNSFVAPYTFLAEEIEDPYTDKIVTAQNVIVRQTPDSNGQVVGYLSYDLVKGIYQSSPAEETIDGETYSWIKIETTEEITGYVYGKYIRSPIDYRLNFVKKDDTWKIVFFVSGD